MSSAREREKLSAKDLCDIVSELVECEGQWYFLSIYMGVPKSKVDQISATHGNDANPCRRGLLEGVSYWLDNTANPSWSSITKALYKLEKKNLARKIAEKYGNYIYYSAYGFNYLDSHQTISTSYKHDHIWHTLSISLADKNHLKYYMSGCQ